jgi:Fe-S oxidoreductase
MLAGKNINKFKELEVKKVVTLCPHAYNVMKNHYPALGGSFQVYHYTHLLADLIRKGKMKLSSNKAKVVYQDPCFLGRYNQVYEEPRKVLSSITGLELAEMERNRRDSFCCGGGGGNFVMDLLAGSEESPSRVRVREAHAAGADTLAVACPSCLTMLSEAAKSEDLDGKLAVKDIAQVVKESLALKM